MATQFTLTAVGMTELRDGLAAYPEVLTVALKVGMTTAVLFVEGAVKADTPRRTGRLQSAWSHQVKTLGGDTMGIVANVVNYGPFVEEDTKAHDIVAHGKALMIPMLSARKAAASFASGGSIFGGARLSGAPRVGQQVAFRKRVHHPGTHGKHMTQNTALSVGPKVNQIFFDVAQEALKMVHF